MHHHIKLLKSDSDSQQDHPIRVTIFCKYALVKVSSVFCYSQLTVNILYNWDQLWLLEQEMFWINLLRIFSIPLFGSRNAIIHIFPTCGKAQIKNMGIKHINSIIWDGIQSSLKSVWIHLSPKKTLLETFSTSQDL